MNNIKLVGTFLCLWLSTMFNAHIQDVMAYILILTVGVLHGSNDMNIIRRVILNKGKNLKGWSILRYYILTVLLILVIFALFPLLALFFFILVSGYHFGEQHLKSFACRQTLIIRMVYLLYGLTVLFMVFYFNINRAIPIFKDLIAIGVTSALFGNLLLVFAFLLIASMGFCVFKGWLRLILYKELFYFVILYVLFNTADLLWGFAIYFILWHSLPSLRDQIIYLYGQANRQGVLYYLKSSWLYWVVSMLGLFLLVFIFKNNAEFLTTILIYFLAAITFPHVIVMSQLENH